MVCARELRRRYEKYGKDVYYSFDRKEVKDHGEGGMFVGKQPEDNEKVVIVEAVERERERESYSLFNM